jgi:hypothetical protein
MSSIVRPTRPRQPVPRRLHLLLKDGTAIEGVVKVGANQSLVAFLNSRSGWMNVTQARRPKLDETEGHMIVHMEQIVMASAPDGRVQVASTLAAATDERIVELTLLGGRSVRGYLPAAPGQRLSDCVAAAGRFMGVSLARLYPEEQDVGDVAIQTAALTVVRDLRTAAPQEPDSDSE